MIPFVFVFQLLFRYQVDFAFTMSLVTSYESSQALTIFSTECKTDTWI